MLDIVGQLKNNSLSLGAILKDDASKLEEIEAQTGTMTNSPIDTHAKRAHTSHVCETPRGCEDRAELRY